jgi:hypothetical protein
MLDLITCTYSRETPTSTRIIIYVNYNEYIVQKIAPISTNKLELIKQTILDQCRSNVASDECSMFRLNSHIY